MHKAVLEYGKGISELIDKHSKETTTQLFYYTDQLEFYLPLLQFVDKTGLKTIFQKTHITCTCCGLNLLYA